MNRTTLHLLVSITCMLILAAPATIIAQEVSNASPVAVGSIAYSGELSPAELMTEEFHRITDLDADAEISFKVSVPVVEKGKVLVNSVDGLPLGNDERNNPPTAATVTVPFSTSEFQDANGLNAGSFEAAVDDTLRNLRQDSNSGVALQGKVKGSTTQSGALNQPNCGGYPLGTVVTVRTESCLLGTTINEYTCSINPNTGQKAWYLTSSQWIPPPSATSCFPGGN